MISLTKYLAVSAIAAGAVTYHAFSTRHQYFPAVFYMATSKVSIAVMGNMSFALALLLYKMITRVFLGVLRDAEVELINDRLSQAVMETCLAMTIFQREFNAEFITMFTVLTFIKVFHWLLQDRVDFLETSPNVSRLQHFRIVAFQCVLLVPEPVVQVLDCAFLQYTIGTMRRQGPSVLLLFTFEYVILASTVLSIGVKYVLFLIDSFLEGRWEGKGVYVFYLDLVTTMLHLVVYLIFFLIVFNNYGLPLHLVRDLYWTFRTFRNRVSDFLRYRRVTVNMDDRFPEATAEDLTRSDSTCIVCREEMTLGNHNKKLRCGHVFHLRCLRSWLERQQNCPICRNPVVEPTPTPQPAPPRQQPQQQAPPAQPQRPPAPPPPASPAPAPTQQPGAEANQARAAAVPPQRPSTSTREPPAGAAAASGPAQQGSSGQATAPAQVGVAATPYMAPGIVYNMPTFPMTSMALYIPSSGYPMQYAGQQNPGSGNMPVGSQGPITGVVPVMPLLFPPPIPAPTGALTPEQQQAALAAAAAASAAASVLGPFGLPLVPALTPGMMAAPPAASSAANGAHANVGASVAGPSYSGGPSSNTSTLPSAEQQLLAANASAAAAAAAMVHVPGGVGSHSTQEELDKMLERHMNLLRRQMEQIRQQQQVISSPVPASNATTTPSGAFTNTHATSTAPPAGPSAAPGTASSAEAVSEPPPAPSTSAAAASAAPATAKHAAEGSSSVTDNSSAQQGSTPPGAATGSADPAGESISEEEQLRLKRLARFGA